MKKDTESSLRQYNFRLAKPNEVALDELSRITGLSKSEVVRTAIMVFRAMMSSVSAPPEPEQ